MRHLIIATAVLMTSPAFAESDCLTPPGLPPGSARWSLDGKVVKRYLTTSNGNLYNCGPEVRQNNPSRQAGSKEYFKQSCGPLTIASTLSYRNCTLEESTGFRSRIGHPVLREMVGILCRKRSNITFDTIIELTDKNGYTFMLETQIGMMAMSKNQSYTRTCNSNLLTSVLKTTWDVGLTNKKITRTEVRVYEVENTRQPSL